MNFKVIDSGSLFFFFFVLLKDSKALLSKEKEVKNLEKELNVLLEESEKDAHALAAAQQHFNAVSAGLSSNKDGEEATLSGQMMICKNEISKAVTEAKQVRKKPTFLRPAFMLLKIV